MIDALMGLHLFYIWRILDLGRNTFIAISCSDNWFRLDFDLLLSWLCPGLDMFVVILKILIFGLVCLWFRLTLDLVWPLL